MHLISYKRRQKVQLNVPQNNNKVCQWCHSPPNIIYRSTVITRDCRNAFPRRTLAFCYYAYHTTMSQ